MKMVANTHASHHIPIAIIGMAGRLPQAENLNEFWENLYSGKDTITEIPRQRWNWQDYYGKVEDKPNATLAKWGGFIRGVDEFDAPFFNLSLTEAEWIDPQHRMFLQTTWETIEDAGYRASDLSGRDISVFVGVSTQDYRKHLELSGQEVSPLVSTGMAVSMLANRVSYFFNFKGPSDITDTACSSSFMALHRAVRSIREDGCEMAIAGGVNLILTPDSMIAFYQAGMLSADPTVKAFDEKANGYVRGEGVGAVLLKPLDKAIEDGDAIYGIVKGCAVNHNGRGYSLTAPDTKGQVQVIADAFRDAGDLSPETISYVEAHGTATRVGDYTEVRAFKKAFAQLKAPSDEHCKIGALKPNIGHLEAASGMAALFKVLLSMKYGVKLGVKNLEVINSSLRLSNSPFYLSTNHEIWERQQTHVGKWIPRRACLHSFGFGGANGHVILEDYVPENKKTPVNNTSESSRLFLFSAKTEDALKRNVAKYIPFLQTAQIQNLDPSERSDFLRDLSFTLLVGREAFDIRLGIVASTVEELLLQLQNWQSSISAPSAQAPAKLYNFLNDWQQGKDIDVTTLFANDLPQRRHGLPTYAFECRHCWIQDVHTNKPNNLVLTTEAADGHVVRDPAIMLSILTQMIGDILGDERQLDAESSLIALGLDSLMLTYLKNRLERRFRVPLSFDLLSEMHTLQNLADYLSKETKGPVAQNETYTSELPRAPLSETYPLTEEQLRYWRMHQFNQGPEQQCLSLPLLINFRSKLNPQRVEQALRLMIQRQESLRLVFIDTAEGVRQRILDHIDPPFTHVVAEEGEENAIAALTENLIREPWHLETGPLWRVGLCQQKEQTSLFLVIHHIISDSWSGRVFLQDLKALIQAWEMAQPNPLKALPYTFTDFVHGEQLIPEDETDKKRTFWKDLTQRPVASLALPYLPNSNKKETYEASTLEGHLTLDELQKFQEAGQSGAWTAFTMYLGALVLSLYGKTEQKNILVGIPFENRVDQEWESVIGCFAKVSFILVDVDENESIHAFLDRLQHLVMNLRSNALGLSETAALLQRTRRDGNNPIQVMLNYMPHHEAAHFENASTDLITFGRTFVNFELSVMVTEKKDEVNILLEYAKSLFDTDSMETFCKQYQRSLHFLSEDCQKSISDIFGCEEFSRKKLLYTMATFTADELQESLTFWDRQLQLNTRFQFAGFNQVFQELLNPKSVARTNTNGANVLLLRLSDWLDKEESDPSKNKNQLTSITQDFIQTLHKILDVSYIPYLLVLCPEDHSRFEQKTNTVIATCQQNIIAEFSSSNQVGVLSAEKLLQQHFSNEIFAPELDALGAIPYHDAFFATLGTQISRWIFARWRPPIKVVVVDGDMTLWKGVVGEDGVGGVTLDSGRHAFQEKLHQLQRNGVLLCLCSKNAEGDVQKLLREHQDFLLQENHFVSLRVNWHRKSENLKKLANELNLSLNSFVFIDDNPLEIAEVREHCPEVIAVPFPSSDEHILDFVEHNWLFDLGSATETDAQRTRWVRENLQRKKAQDRIPSYTAFIEDLKLQIHLTPMKTEHIARVSQLTQRTNQFNTTTIRQTEEQLRQVMQQKNSRVEVVYVKDRFGDYGLVGVMVLDMSHEKAVLQSLLLSCRVLGRGVEHAMIVKAAQIAEQHGFEQLDIHFVPSHRNEPAKAFLGQLPRVKKDALAMTCKIDALLNVKFDPDNLQNNINNQNTETGEGQSAQITKQSIDIDRWMQVWLHTKTPKNLVSRLRPSKKSHLPLHKRVPPQTETEKQLASVWERILNIEGVCVVSSFYEMGGTSLELAQVLLEIRTTLHIPLPYHLFLKLTNIRDVAEVIERFVATGNFEKEAFPDLVADAALPEYIQQKIHNAKPAENLDRTKHLCVLLTGTTGYVGAFLLHELLKKTAWHITCLVRAQDAENGYERVQANLEKYGFRPDVLRERVDIIIGDLSQERFGLTESDFEHLGAKISGIYHNGAQVDFTRSYNELKAVNLDGTKTCVHLASMSKLKPIFYVSTASVFDSDMFQNDQEVDEVTLLPETAKVHGGYAQSKWAAEQAVTQAANCGLPVAIFRPNGIGPSLDPNHARFNDDDAFALVLLASLNVGMFFDLPIHVDFSPVDYVASALVELSLQPFSPGQVYALTNPHLTTLEHVQQLLEDLGESVTLVDYTTWVAAIEKHARETQNQKLLALLPLMQEPITPQGASWFELGATRPRFCCHKTLNKLQKQNITCPEVNHNTMMRLLLLSFLHANYVASKNAPPLLKNNTVKDAASTTKTLLILSWSLGEGHNTAALAIEQAMRKTNAFDIVKIDLGEHMSLVKNLERVWRHLSRNFVSQLYAYNDLVQSSRQHDHPQFSTVYHHTVTHFLATYQPDAVISVCPLGSQLLTVFKALAPQIKTATYVSDWFGGTYKEWGDSGADWIYSPSSQCTQFLQEISESDLSQRIVTGAPILRPEFSNQIHSISKAEQKSALGFEPNDSILLFNSYGSLQTLSLLENLNVPHLHIVVLCYNNEAILERITRLDENYEGHIVGKLWIENLQEWLTACDVIYTKPGPGICMEALVAKTTLFLNAIDGIMPQELVVYKTLLQEGLGVGIASKTDFESALQNWLSKSTQYREICEHVAAGQFQDGCAKFMTHITQEWT